LTLTTVFRLFYYLQVRVTRIVGHHKVLKSGRLRPYSQILDSLEKTLQDKTLQLILHSLSYDEEEKSFLNIEN
jgi:hypothetical protein